MYEFAPAIKLLPQCLQAASKSPWQLVEADVKQKYELLTSPSLGRQLYGSERVTLDQIPYMITPGNYSIIMENENPHVIVEILHGRYVSVSFGSSRETADPKKLCVVINIYTKDPQRAAAHAQRQIADAVKANLHKEIVFIVSVDVLFTKGSKGREAISNAMEHLGLKLVLSKDIGDFHVKTAKLKESSEAISRKPLPCLPKGVTFISKL